MHHMHRRLWAGLVAPSFLLAAWGCGGAPAVTSSTTQGTVKGSVTVDGKRASSGAVLFDGANSSRPSLAPVRAEIGKDGTYEVKAFVGSNRVSLSGPALLKMSPAVQLQRLSCEVASGDNSYDIDIKK